MTENVFAAAERHDRRYRIVNMLDESTLRRAARDTDLGTAERETMSVGELRTWVLHHWEEAESYVFEYLNGAREQ